MKSHELAKMLLDEQDCEINASTGISILGDEETFYDRFFSKNLWAAEYDGSDFTLIFEAVKQIKKPSALRRLNETELR